MTAPGLADEQQLQQKRRRIVDSDDDGDDGNINGEGRVGPAGKKPRANGVDGTGGAAKAKTVTALPAGKVKKEPPVKQEPRSGKPIKDKPSTKTAKEKKPAKAAKVKEEETPAKMEARVDGDGGEDAEDDEDEDDEETKWWKRQQLGDGDVRWTTLEHNGVMFPPEYEPLPFNVKLLYDGKPVDLPPPAEEVAGFFGAMLETDHAANPTFQRNFFRDFKAVAETHGVRGIEAFEKCDFSQIHEHYVQQREHKKRLTKEEKKAIKERKELEEAPFRSCLLDGREEKVGNFRIEPPGLFRGRGSHPKTGTLKQRVQPEQITLNIGEGVRVPTPPAGHQWAEVRHDNTVTWLAMWQENVNNNVKYVFLAPGSSIKGQSDMKKYEKARKLKFHIEDIRKRYTMEMRDQMMEVRQRATAMYLIDIFALRAGNEKGDDEADTVGCCSLRYEHVTLQPPATVIFDFLGKDSIRYYNEVQVDPQAFKNLKIFKRAPKTEGDMIFDRLNTTKLNAHLSSLMPGLSAKVFRTYNASHTMFAELKKATPARGTVQEKVLAYNRANRTVAILCNHQRSVSKMHDSQMERFDDRIRELKYQRQRARLGLLQLEPKLANKKLTEPESDIDDEWISSHEQALVARKREQVERKLARENEKLREQNQPERTPAQVVEQVEAAAAELQDQFDREHKESARRHTRWVEVPPRATAERLQTQLDRLDERISASKVQRTDRDENKTTALGTSKINYMDPRITVAWCKKYGVPIEKMFTKTLREKFMWANDVDADWEW